MLSRVYTLVPARLRDVVLLHGCMHAHTRDGFLTQPMLVNISGVQPCKPVTVLRFRLILNQGLGTFVSRVKRCVWNRAL